MIKLGIPEILFLFLIYTFFVSAVTAFGIFFALKIVPRGTKGDSK